MTTRFACGVCGQDHATADHELSPGNREAFERMAPEGLHHLRDQLIDEIVIAVKRGADAAVLHDFGVVLCAIDRRLDD